MNSRKLLLIVFLAVTGISIAMEFTGATVKYSVPPPAPTNNYDKQWQKIDSLENKGLPKSALEIVNKIYTQAKTEKNAAQFIKAIIHRMKFEQYVEEYSLEKALNKLNDEVKGSEYPITPILHSMIAENYWQYYQNNRWKFHDRTEAVNFKQDDITTWDLKTIFSQVVYHYNLSISNPGQLKQTPLNIYDAIVISGSDSRKFRPTLYDFLAHRAVDFYMNDEPDIIQPSYKFELNKENYFSAAEEFSRIKVESKDTLSSKLYATRILQDLIAFHLNDASPEALIDVDLKRIKFVRNQSVIEIKDSLYLEALQKVENKFSTHPASAEVSCEIARVYFERGSKYNPLQSGESKWLKKKALEICESTNKKFPGSYGAKNCEVLKAQILEKSIDFTTEKVTSSNQPFLALVTYKNLKTAYVRISQINIDDYNKSLDRYYGEQLIKQHLKLTPVKEWAIELPDDGDYQQHSIEISMPSLPYGHYVVLIGSDKSFSYKKNAVAYAPVWISDISYVSRNLMNGSADFYMLQRETGQPLNNVEAQLYISRYDYKSRKYITEKAEKYISDESGYFQVKPTGTYRNFTIEFTLKTNNVTDKLYTGGSTSQEKEYNNSQKRTNTYFFLDRAIYRPGQTVYFKGIVIQGDGEKNEILTNHLSTVTLYDANNQRVTGLDLTTNEYGTFTGSFTAPVDLLNGLMSIRNENGSVYFSVEEYKRPKFYVEFNPVKGSYRLNETIKLSGAAKAYSGANIDGAEVKYRVVRNSSFPSWWGWWRGYYPQSPSMEIVNGVTISNDSGAFFIDFKAIPDLSLSKSYEPTYTYTVYADVTDINGETRSSQTNVSVAYTALKMSVDISEILDNEGANGFAITTTNMSGQFEPAEGKVEIYQLKQPKKSYRERNWNKPDKYLISKEEFEKLYPKDEYKDENNAYTWPRAEKIIEKRFNNRNNTFDSLKITNLRSLNPGIYVMEANTKDVYGEPVKDLKYFTIYSNSGKEIPGNKIDWFNLITDGPIEPGEKAKFAIGTKEQDVRVLYEIEHKGKIVKKEFITLSDEQKIIEIPIEEQHRGNFAVHCLFIKDNRSYWHNAVIQVPYTNKQIDIEFETFRDKLNPGQQEEWKIKIKDKKGERLAAEMVATLYDASLDAFKKHNWLFNILNYYHSQLYWSRDPAFGSVNAQTFSIEWNTYPPGAYRDYERLNWFGYENYGYGVYALEDVAVTTRGSRSGVKFTPPRMKSRSITAGNLSEDEEQKAMKDEAAHDDAIDAVNAQAEPTTGGEDLSGISARTNFNETAFFNPQLQTDKDGAIIIKFTIPEALTKWKMMGLAHTKDLKYGQIEKELVTQKDLMVVPNAPRFFRENDQMEFSAKITNLSEKDLSGTAQVFFYSALDSKDITSDLTKKTQISFTSKKGQSSRVSWNIQIPEGISAITYKVVAKANNFTDGEEMTLPVLTNRMLVTETLPLPIRGKQTKTYSFEKLINQNNGSTTLRNHKLTLEFTPNPAWYAVQALPYLMEYPYECAEQVFSRFYANSIASHIANSSPKIKAVFDSWKTQSPEALLSNLEKNQELKSLFLEETPWVMDAKDESERKSRIGLLFDLNKMDKELAGTLKKLRQMQSSNGGWPWFSGMPDDRYITQHIITGLGHLDHLGIKDVRQNNKVWNMVQDGVRYLDDRIREDYEWVLKHDKDYRNSNNLGYSQIQYLYARSYFKDISMDNRNQKAFEYYKEQATKFWLKNSRYMQGMIALALYRYEDKTVPMEIIRSLKENSITSEEMGMYWKESYDGFYWYQAPIEAQALLIEAFDEVANDKKSVDDLKVWLLKSKQTQNWKTTKATTEAVYALLLKGTDWLATESNVEVSLGGKLIDPKKTPGVKEEAGTGYFKTSWSDADVKPEMGNVSVTKKDEGVSWGALYWQYFEQLDKITPAKTPLSLKKQLFIEKNTERGPVIEPVNEKTVLKPGDKIKVRIELRVDRDMEYVHMKDMRASGFEPVNVLSIYKWQDGLGYYESTGDAATNFFFSHLQKGTYVFEYPLMVTHNGNFSNGVTSIQCMYAPEFSSHSEGIRVKVGN